MEDVSITTEEEATTGYRLSPQQCHTWLLQQPNQSRHYQALWGIIIEGNINIKLLKEALQKVINRHEILRTTFYCLPGMTIPLQKINDEQNLSMEEYDLSNLDADEQIVKVDFLLNKLAEQYFNFEKSPLLQSSIVKLLDYKYILLFKLPAICADKISLEVLCNEIIRLYNCYKSGNLLQDIDIQYADIAEWFYQILEDEDTQAGRDYWNSLNISRISASKLVIETNHNLSLEFQPKILPIENQSKLLSKIENLIQEDEVNLEDFLLAAWYIFLWKLTGYSNKIIGILANGRNYEEIEKSLGLFAKYLPFYMDLEPDYNFHKIVKEVKTIKNLAYKWQDYFSWESLLGEEDLNYFPYCFDFEEEISTYQFDDISFCFYKKYVCFDRYKVKLSCIYSEKGLELALHYDENLYFQDDIKELVSQFEKLLMSIIHNPDEKIKNLDLLTPKLRQKILVDFNNTTIDYPRDKCIHNLFEAQATQIPTNIAAVCEDKKLTYEEINQKSNQLAHYLRSQGVKNETIVGLYVERSLDVIVGILGILKAGGAYLPIDSTLPIDGVNFRLSDAKASIVLTQQALSQRISNHTTTIICLDTDWENISAESQENPNTTINPNNLVYIIYTSGSTGQPKGVAVEHGQLMNYVYSILDRLSLSQGSSFATVSTFAADLGNTAIFPSLCIGGTLHLISYEKATDSKFFREYCSLYPIDCLKIVPSHLGALLKSSQPEGILPRKCLILGGEACSWSLIDEVKKYTSNCKILNHYGPTETTIGVLTYEVGSNNSYIKNNTVPLGRPISNTQIYILDENLNPLPIGIPGELHIGGANVSRGYLNRPNLTAERFITNPFSDDINNVLYKTGDLARYLPTGDIEFLGRIDRQIKIRGFRIELEEIETVLNQHQNVQGNVVIAWEDETKNKRLVAYVVTKQDSKVESTQLREFLANKLPEFMIPNLFVFLDALPLTANGKIDRHALPSPDKANPNLNYVAPRNAIEEILVDIWSEILHLEKIGIHDRFFELGGHSLLATQLISRIRNTFKCELTLRSLFEKPTIAYLSQILIENEIKVGITEKIAKTLVKIKHMSPEEKAQLLAQKRKGE